MFDGGGVGACTPAIMMDFVVARVARIGLTSGCLVVESAEDGHQGWKASKDDLLGRRVQMHDWREKKREKGRKLTPTFISMVPHKTSIVELPFFLIVRICTMRMIEQTVVKRPSAKTPIKPIFFRR